MLAALKYACTRTSPSAFVPEDSDSGLVSGNLFGEGVEKKIEADQ